MICLDADSVGIYLDRLSPALSLRPLSPLKGDDGIAAFVKYGKNCRIPLTLPRYQAMLAIKLKKV